jgi:MFS family permease
MGQDLGARGPLIAQMTMAMASLGLMSGCIVSGWILERSGTRTTLLVSLVVFGCMGAMGLIVRDPALLLASRFVLGFASACMGTTCLWGIAAEYAGDHRAKVLGISAAASNAFALGTTILGGYIAQGGWALDFWQYPVFGAVGLVIAYAGVRQVRPEPTDATATSADRGPLKRLLPFYVLVTVMFIAMFMSSIQFAFIMQQDGIANSGRRSLYLAIVTVTAACLSFRYGALQRHLGIAGSFAFGAGCMALGMLIAGWANHPAYLIAAALFMGLYIGVLGPWIYQVVSEQTDPSSRGRAIGLLGAFGYLGGSLNPIALAPLADVIGLRKVYLCAAALMLTLCIGGLSRALRQRIPVTAP